MAEILKEWLSQTLERPITWAAEEFGNMMKNGHIVATVLRCYHVINDDKHYLIRTSNEEDDIKHNWKYLREWLKDIEVNVSEEDLNNIIKGKGSSLLRLFYQLFLHLDKCDRTNFIKREQKMMSNLIEKMENRFAVHSVPKNQKSFVSELSKPLLDERKFIEWQKQKTKQVKESFDYLRHKYLRTFVKMEESKAPLDYNCKESRSISDKEKKEIEKFELKYPCKFQNYTFEELSALEEKALKRKKSLIDSEWATEYMNNLFDRMRKKSDSEEFQRQMGNALGSSLWNVCVTEEEDKVDMELAKKVMKLSEFEKQMCTQIMETKQQARNLIKNRIQGEKEFVEQKEHQMNIFFEELKEKIISGDLEVDFEKTRQNSLHNKLFAEKMKRKRQMYHEICYETLIAIVDYAVKYGYFKKLMDGDVPEQFVHEWKSLFFKHQPIFDILSSKEDILKLKDTEEISCLESSSFETEEIIRVECERQGVLDSCEFEEYHSYLYPWKLEILIPNFDPDSEERKFEHLGMRVLGHVIYTLLELKYPYPSANLPAELPEYSSKSLLRGLPDKSLMQVMQSLLTFRKIHVVRLEAVINYCLRQFKTEMIGRDDIDLSFDDFIHVAQDEENKEFIKSMKSEDESYSKSDVINSELLLSSLPNTKQTQTPKCIPEDNISLSAAANLGKYAYNTLTQGETLTDYLMTAMIIEYLKNQKEINGFVIINYPNSYHQAQILEESFSGYGPPDAEELDDNDDVHLEESIIKHRKKEVDPYKELRTSKFLSNPHIRMVEKPFETYFTSYIHLKHTDDILKELVIWQLNHDNSDLTDRFYASMGINYSLYYEIVDKELLAQICKYIIGDFSFPLKSYNEIFGHNVLNELDFPNIDGKRINSKIVKPDVASGKSKEKIRKGSKLSKMSNETELEVIKAPHSFEDVPQSSIKSLDSMISQDIKSKSLHSLNQVKIMAGDENWVFADLPIAETIGISLANYWEEVEKLYVNNMKQLFFAKRLQMNCVIPYTRFLKDKMNQIITLPSNKQDLVSEFQKKYNDFENDWRNVNLTKNEWHCRVKELQTKLYKICDERKVTAQQQRHALICNNWALEELTTLVNTYISCMQAEMNRSIMTFQIFHDFYFTMLKGSPPSERLSSKDLTKIFRETDKSSSSSKKGGDEKLYKQLKTVFQDLYVKGVEFDYSKNPFNFLIENNVKFASKIIKDMNESYRSLISKEYNEKAKTVPIIKKRDGHNSVEPSNLEEILRNNTVKCLEEWSMGVNGEMFRFNLRILALQHKCYNDMKVFNDLILKTFIEIQNEINAYYMNEIKSVDRLCKYLHMAIEKGIGIPETLILEKDKFEIDLNVCQFAPSSPNLGLENKSESVEYYKFKTGQLARLRSQFKIVAPTGIVLHQAFIYLLQDFIMFGKENLEGSLFPEAWKNVDREDVPKLVLLLFGETAYVDWRDFLIYCLQIRFPSINELLQLRKKFRCNDNDSKEITSRDFFINEKLWFENDFVDGEQIDQLQLNLMKHFLFELYETAENFINYSAFLLAFCKNSDPIKGFVAALSMAVGQEICYSQEECGEVVASLIKAKKYKDESLASALKCAAQFLNNLIQNVIETCEGVTIEELKYVQTLTDDKKGKKGRNIGKPKKTEVNQNEGVGNLQKVLKSRSKLRISTDTNGSKAALVCPPCEQVDLVNDTDKESEKNFGEPEIEVTNPNLIYAVNKSVIWNVLKICLPWHFQLLPETNESPYVQQVEEILSRLELDTDNKDIYICKLVSDPKFCKLLRKVKKFTAINLADEIQQII
ncbi:unnamed protein product [Parnassius mnemosyne]|uniref:Calponin-homology (CH) domain-containing protein n=1 Tax=Parnassius mnemosyne TaxID=213953 RepID=A0AAV1KVW8_9NEOP